MQIISPECRCLLGGRHAKGNKNRELALMTQKKETRVRDYERCSQQQHQHCITKINFSKQ